jgi:hypothetical protein
VTDEEDVGGFALEFEDDGFEAEVGRRNEG